METKTLFMIVIQGCSHWGARGAIYPPPPPPPPLTVVLGEIDPLSNRDKVNHPDRKGWPAIARDNWGAPLKPAAATTPGGCSGSAT